MHNLKPQLHAPRGPEPFGQDGFRPVEMSENNYPSVKPASGGLWTSTYLGPQGSDWIQWCMSESFYIDQKDPRTENPWLLVPAVDARVYEIDSYSDLATLCKRHGHRYDSKGLDYTKPNWSSISEEYDAVHLTARGETATRLSLPLDLYGWDCESTLWFRWKFDTVTPLGPRRWEPYANAWWLEESAA